MIKNLELYDKVITELAKKMNEDLKLKSENSEELAKGFIESTGTLETDEDYRITFMFGDLVAHGFDLSNDLFKKYYKNRVERVKMVSSFQNQPIFISEGRDEKKNIGWYFINLK